MSALLGALASRIITSSIRPLWSRALSPATTGGSAFPLASTTTTWVTSRSLGGQFLQPTRALSAEAKNPDEVKKPREPKGPGSSFFPQFRNLPPVNPMAAKGDSYRTVIDRKRKIPNPNKASLVHHEPKLKWTTLRMLRDVRRRQVFTRYWFDRAVLQNIDYNRVLPVTIRQIAGQTHKKLPRDSNYHTMYSRCSISGRARGVVKKYRMSRFVFRNLADYNKLSGVIKACW